MKTKVLIHKYSHAWVFLYWALYLPWFGWLEKTVTTSYHVLQSSLDQYIPFLEGFIIPYLLWFPFVGVTIAWFFFHDRQEFYQLTAYLYVGMTLFLVICTVFPNGLHLRPAVLPRDNLCSDLVRAIWKVDTPTNVLPSLHVYNSVVCCAAVFRSRSLQKRPLVRAGVLTLTVSIVLSTMFLKQHSVIDVVSALALARVLYPIIYVRLPQRRLKLAKDSL